MAKIVFCEDDKFIRLLIQMMLRATSHEVYIACDGVEGLALIEKHRPELIVTDICMPYCNGLELLSHVKKNKELASIPVVLASALSDSEIQEEGYRLGAVDYLLKPFTKDQLLSRIASFLPVRAETCPIFA